MLGPPSQRGGHGKHVCGVGLPTMIRQPGGETSSTAWEIERLGAAAAREFPKPNRASDAMTIPNLRTSLTIHRAYQREERAPTLPSPRGEGNIAGEAARGGNTLRGRCHQGNRKGVASAGRGSREPTTKAVGVPL